MDTVNLGPAPAPAGSRPPGRTRRVLTSIAAGAILLGAGAGIGIALTGGASASTAGTASASRVPGRCAKIAGLLKSSDHPAAAMRLQALCSRPLLRLALVGGEYGQVTFRGKTSARTIAFERGTVESVTGSQITVKAPDGTTWTWDLSTSTSITAAGQKTTQAKLSSGDTVFVGGPVAGGAHDARLVKIRKAA